MVANSRAEFRAFEVRDGVRSLLRRFNYYEVLERGVSLTMRDEAEGAREYTRLLRNILRVKPDDFMSSWGYYCDIDCAGMSMS